jgi:hypothetical protein
LAKFLHFEFYFGKVSDFFQYINPCFKDVNLYTHPPNDDTLKKQCNGEMDLYLTNPRELNETEKGSLVSAVKVNKLFLRASF